MTFVAAFIILYFDQMGSFSTVKSVQYQVPVCCCFNAEQTAMQTNYLIGMLYDLPLIAS